MDDNIKQFEILFETLERSAKTKTNISDKDAINIIEDLDQKGTNIIYILYSMFMKKNNLPLNKFILKETETPEQLEIEMDFKKMPGNLKSILLQFADRHSQI
ncbi:hypothetical protein IIV31_029L [Armadillidium vulgare iridescent virus]|uniref:Uncharacterized protein n=1 Tax=Armadillidium vulgare iridescent virus TaxID=72201 RepID=A0A068QKB8_9VIRU|nr:hypothetical protein IIV31_029L [Armadillidium vulgare iridescent virus]CCV02401.1 hypothetical protein IIV31_029L [Armadillidium vulgare iridescent virus]